MAPEITMKQKRRGPLLTLNFTVISQFTTLPDEPAHTDSIDVNDLALVRFTFNYVKHNGILESTIKFKKSEKAKLTTVKIHFICGDLDEELFCYDDWMERKMGRKLRDYNVGTEKTNTAVTSIIVNITVHEIITPNSYTGFATLTPPWVKIPPQAKKLHEDTTLTDFHLHATDGAVAVHKAVLAMHSDVFMTMLSGKWKETEEGHVNIDGATTQTLQHLKRYIYLGTLPSDGLMPLLLVAARYMMDDLKTDCIMKLLEAVTPETLDILIEFACAKNVPDLMKAILFETPDSIVNGLYDLKLKEKKTNDENE